MPVSNGMLILGTCLSKEREARLNFGELRSDVRAEGQRDGDTEEQRKED